MKPHYKNMPQPLKSYWKKQYKFIMKRSLSAKNPSECIALEVKNSHWVWVIGRYIPLLGYRILDPIGGKKRYTNYYGNKITGHAIVIS